MANFPDDRKYTDQHEWILLDGDTATVGITDYAQEQLTDVVFVELPEVGRRVKAGESVAVLESVKSVADVYAPFGGEVTDINSELEEHPEKVNDDAFGEGWIFKLKSESPDISGLLNAEAYRSVTEAEQEG